MRNKELIALLQEQDPEAEVMIRTSDGEYEYDPVDNHPKDRTISDFQEG